jgi:membrane protein YdbS with pleckstrin-like domain
MRFIKKKNLIAGEEILYTPNLHWMYTVKKPLLFLLVIPVLLIIRAFVLFLMPMDFFYYSFRMILDNNIMQLILGIVIIAFVILAWRIFLYLSVEYGVTNKRLLMKKGIFRVVTSEIPMDRIESIYCAQGLLGKLFKYGTVCISGVGGRMPIFYMVTKPYALRRKIVEIIEKNKTINVVHGDLPKPKPIVKEKPVVVEEPVYRYGTFVRMLSDGPKKAGD